MMNNYYNYHYKYKDLNANNKMEILSQRNKSAKIPLTKLNDNRKSNVQSNNYTNNNHISTISKVYSAKPGNGMRNMNNFLNKPLNYFPKVEFHNSLGRVNNSTHNLMNSINIMPAKQKFNYYEKTFIQNLRKPHTLDKRQSITANPVVKMNSGQLLSHSFKVPNKPVAVVNPFERSTKPNKKNIPGTARKNSEETETNVYNTNAKSVPEYSYEEDKNSEHRNSMEDFHKIVDKFMSYDTRGFFSLYDGHGGTQCAKYAKERMPKVFAEFLQETNHNIEKSLIYSFQKVDNELKVISESQNSGTTATVVYFNKEGINNKGNKGVIYCANVGDTRCVLITTTEWKRMSYDHKPTDETESKRIKNLGGAVFNGRVFGQLSISRALGDHSMKKNGVIPTPSIYKHTITEKDKFLILCSDGVWDVVSEDDILKFSQTCSGARQMTSFIIKSAKQRDSYDNISCIAIKLN